MSYTRLAQKLKENDTPDNHIYFPIENETDEEDNQLPIEAAFNVSAPEPLPLPKLSSLRREIEKCLRILRTAQNTVSEDNQKKQQDYRLTTAWCALNILLVVSSPAVMLAVMLYAMELIRQKAVTSLEKNILEQLYQLNSILPARKKMRDQKFEMYKELYREHNEVFNEWMDAYSRKRVLNNQFFAKVDKENNCVSWVEKDGEVQDARLLFPEARIKCWSEDWGNIEYPCAMRDNNQTHPIAHCNDLMNKICEEEQNIELLEEKNLESLRRRDAAYGVLKEAEKSIKSIEIKINSVKATPLKYNPVDPITTTLFTILSIAAIGALIYKVMSWRNLRNEHQEKIKRANDVEVCLARLDDVQSIHRVLNLLARLEINLNDTIDGIVYPLKIDLLITILEDRLEDIRNREGRAFSFLSGVNYPDTFIANFLKRDGDKNCTKKILEFANLMPTNMMP